MMTTAFPQATVVSLSSTRVPQLGINLEVISMVSLVMILLAKL